MMIQKSTVQLQEWNLPNVSIELREYETLKGSKNIASAKNIDAANKVGMKLKFISAHLNGGEMKTEPGLLHYMKGNLEIGTARADGSTGIGGFFANKIKSSLSGESSTNTVIRGTGQVVLEPTFGHYIVIEMNNESFIADKGIFCASFGSIVVDVAMQKNISSALFGGEGLFQTKVVGTGHAVFNCPVHPDEIVKVELQNDTLRVDGSFAILRSSSLDFTVEKSAKSIFASAKTGEGLLQTFRGTGTVWLAPTEAFYEEVHAMHTQADLSESDGATKNASGFKKAAGIVGKFID
jgi:uncharacterized protein (AIM24 family)